MKSLVRGLGMKSLGGLGDGVPQKERAHMQYDFDLVGKIGSMALIRREDADIDYNIFSRQIGRAHV